jgi:transketolase
LGWSYGDFETPADALSHMRKAVERGASLQAEWEETLATYRTKYADEAAEFERMLSGELPEGWADALPSYTPGDKALATRKTSELPSMPWHPCCQN